MSADSGHPSWKAPLLDLAANVGTDRLDLSRKYHQGCACYRGQALGALVTDDRRQLGEPK